ncbi:MAG: hypothetical protein IT337_18500 [Thermomicrobiales bacterium]|nr:hypothetical protein [Thermomicrobiales bacterium]
MAAADAVPGLQSEGVGMSHRVHRCRTDHDVGLDTKFGPMGIWLSYRDEFYLAPTGPAAHESYHGYGRLRIGTSTVDAYATIEPDGCGGYRIAKLWGTRYFAPRLSWQTHHSEPMTRKQVATMTAALEPVVMHALSTVTAEQIAACHRRSLILDIASERSALTYDLEAVRREVEKAQGHYDAIRAMERDLGLPASPVPRWLEPADADLDAALADIDRLDALSSHRLRAIGGAQ